MVGWGGGEGRGGEERGRGKKTVAVSARARVYGVFKNMNNIGAPDLPLFHYAQTTQSGGGVSLFGPPPVFFGPPFCVATETGLEALR